MKKFPLWLLLLVFLVACGGGENTENTIVPIATSTTVAPIATPTVLVPPTLPPPAVTEGEATEAGEGGEPAAATEPAPVVEVPLSPWPADAFGYGIQVHGIAGQGDLQAVGGTDTRMKLHISNIAGLNIFTAYGEGFVAVNQEKYATNLIVLPESMVFEWSTATPATLAEGGMQKLLELGMEIVLLGTGNRQRFPAGALMRPFAPAGIGLEVMDLRAACRTYNVLAAEGRKVAAALLFD